MSQENTILCPYCEWKVTSKALWKCSCGKSWKPFANNGSCSNCGINQTVIECPVCSRVNPYQDWLKKELEVLREEAEKKRIKENRKGFDWVEELIDNYLSNMAEENFLTPGKIPQEMYDESKSPNNDWKGWKPITSIIQNEHIDKFEERIGFPFPESYRHYLKYKHFFSLHLQNKLIRLPSHLPDVELSELSRMTFDLWDPDQVIGKGYIYFADYEDYGLLCFDANCNREGNEFPIIYLDHETLEYEGYYRYESFEDLLKSKNEAWY